jgi:hypothetical protein
LLLKGDLKATLHGIGIPKPINQFITYAHSNRCV